MLVHAQFVFAALDLRCHTKLDALLQGCQAEIRASLEGVARVLSNDSDSIRCSLSQRGAIVIGIPTDCTDDVLEIRLVKIGWSQVLNHVVKDEESELLALLLRACEAVWNNLVA